jgi:hypothetical protein
MEKRLTVLERAFELARSGKCLNVSDILKRLQSEKYDITQMEGVALKKQLMALIEEARRLP